MGLFTPVWKSQNLNKRYKAQALVGACTDQRKLTAIARGAHFSNVRQLAVQKLTDQQTLFSIATGEDREMWQWAVKTMTDPALLARVAQEHEDSAVRQLAVTRLDDQSVLERAARNDPDQKVRLSALGRMTDSAKRLKIALADGSESVRKWAVGHTADQELLLRAAKTDADGDVRRAAREKLTDERTKLALDMEDNMIDTKRRILALDVIHPDDAELERLIDKSWNSDFSTAAIARMKDPDALEHVARSEAVRVVYEAAVNRLSRRENLLHLIAEEKTAKAAMVRMRELGMLDEEAFACVHPSAAKDAQLERDRMAFLQSLAAAEDGKSVRKAYKTQNVEGLQNLATPEAVEALILILREFGEEMHGGASKMGWAVNSALHELWRTGDVALRPAIRKSKDWSVRSHDDNGGQKSHCHQDNGPLILEFDWSDKKE